MSSGLMPYGFFVVGQLIAPAGTRTIFHQAAPPPGWAQEVGAAYSDTDLRVNHSSPSTGGSANWSGWNNGGVFNCNAITLSVANLPVHSHGVNDPTHSHGFPGPVNFLTNVDNQHAAFTRDVATNQVGSTSTNSAGLSSNNSGSGGSFTPTFTTPVLKYTDHVIGVKS